MSLVVFMMSKKRTLAAWAVLGASAGCQHDIALRAVDSQGQYAPLFDAHGFAIESGARRVRLDFPKPPIDDSDTMFIYFSIPIHPIKGIQFSDVSIGVGWSDAAMLVSGILVPFTPRNAAYPVWPVPQSTLILLPRSRIQPASVSTDETSTVPDLIRRP